MSNKKNQNENDLNPVEPETNQTDDNQTEPETPKKEPEVFRNSSYAMLEDEYSEMISQWMQKKHVQGTGKLKDLTTNIPDRKIPGGDKAGVLFLEYNS